jgi:hypothetical protein
MSKHNLKPAGNQSGPIADCPDPGESQPRLKVSRPETASDPPFGMLPHSITADRRLKANDVRVLLALTSFAWGSEVECWPSLRSIGERSGLGEKSVRLALQSLAHFGYVRLIHDDSKVSHRRIVLTWRQGDDPLTITPKGALSPRQREVQRVQKYRKTTVSDPSVITAPPLCNYGALPLRNYGPDEETSFKKQDEENRSAAPEPPSESTPSQMPPPVAQEEEKKNEIASLDRNENEEERKKDPLSELTPTMREAISRCLSSGKPALAHEARKKLASIGVKPLAPAPAPGDARSVGKLLPPTLEAILSNIQARAAGDMNAGEAKIAAARAIEAAKRRGKSEARRGNPEVYDAIQRLPDCGQPGVDRFVRLLCREFKATDRQDMQGAYTQVAQKVASGELTTACVAHAFECASGKKIRNPGAAFKSAIDKWNHQGAGGSTVQT